MKKLLLLILSFSTSVASAQVTFQKTFGGTNDDMAFDIKQTTNGGYIITGYTESFGTGDKDVLLIKIDNNGTEEWSKTYGGTSDEEAYSVMQTDDGGYIVCGYTESFGVGGWDVYVIRTDAFGDTLWTKSFGGGSNDRMFGIRQVNDGGFIMANYTTSFGAGNWDVYLVKIDGNGTLKWAKTYGKTSADWANSVHQTNDMGYLIAGASNVYGGGTGHDAYLIKTDSLGNIMWSKNYGATFENDGIDDFALTNDGGYILCGNTWSYGAGGLDILLFKIDSVGDTVWVKTYGGAQNDRAGHIEITNDGGFILSCYTESFGAGSRDMLIVKTDNNGNLEWSHTLGGDSLKFSSSVMQTTDGGYIIAGRTNSFGAGGWDAYVVKTDGFGSSLCNVSDTTWAVTSPTLTVGTPSPLVSGGGTLFNTATQVTTTTLIDSVLCSDTITDTVIADEPGVIFVPDIFSPNNDGQNDFLFVQGKGIQYLNLVVYNRWGELVFENINFQPNIPAQGWDGTYKSKLMNSAVFVFVLTGKYKDGSEIFEKGDFTLIR